MIIKCIDLFCGVGGLTHGLRRGGIDVVAGIDIDPTCRFPYEANNDSMFIERDVTEISAAEIGRLLQGADVRMLAGCAPCQPFSTYTRGGIGKSRDWPLLYKFGRLIGEVRPDLVTMENVPGIIRHKVFRAFVQELDSLGYRTTVMEKAFCPDYGIPQVRKRLILVSSLHGEIPPLQPTHDRSNYRTVFDTIGCLEPIAAGESSTSDPLHASSRLSEINLRRIRASRPGGTWRDWPPDLIAECHRRSSGTTYPSVYGRMRWDEPSPTITTECHGYGNGRFGHPEQDRAISLREAAMLQAFPKHYHFVPPGEPIRFGPLGRLIGNAVPVRLGEVIAEAFIRHSGETGRMENEHRCD